MTNACSYLDACALQIEFEFCFCCFKVSSFRADFQLSKPCSAFALFPLSFLGLARGGRVNADAVLLAVLPLSLILTTIWPMERSLTFLLVINVVALVFTTVRPFEYSMALHFVILPQAFVLSSIGPIVDTCSQE